MCINCVQQILSDLNLCAPVDRLITRTPLFVREACLRVVYVRKCKKHLLINMGIKRLLHHGLEGYDRSTLNSTFISPLGRMLLMLVLLVLLL